MCVLTMSIGGADSDILRVASIEAHIRGPHTDEVLHSNVKT